MKVLGLVGSRRKLGNTEVLVKESLLGAREAGAEVSLLRLTDLTIEQCNGCMACVFKGQPCGLRDDLYFLFDQLAAADAIILGAPTYFLSPAGTVKLIVDRFLMLRPEQLTGKRAVTIVVAGRQGWLGFSVPLLNLFPLAAGYELVDSCVVYAPGPGEALLQEQARARVRTMGGSVVDGSPPRRSLIQQVPDIHCPVCWSASFSIRDSNLIECTFCRVRAELRRGPFGAEVEFDKESIASNRFTLAERQDHMRNWILATKDMFQGHLKDVLRARKPYQDVDIPLLSPENL